MAFKNSLSVCTPIECESVGEMLASMKRAEAEGADLAELRLDSLSFSHDSEVEKLIKHRTLPSIVSFRYLSWHCCAQYILHSTASDIYVFHVNTHFFLKASREHYFL